MFAVRCPSCAAPAEVALATPEVVRCRHCGRSGPPAEADHTRIDRAVARLRSLDMRRYQHRSSAGVARRSSVRRVLGLVALVIPCALTSLLALVSSRFLGSEVGVPAAWASVAVAGGVLLLGLGLALRREAAVQRACTATPPAAPGEPSSCFLCGAQLEGATEGLVVRCTHCGADNVAHPDALARADLRQDVALDDVEAQLWSRARAASSAWNLTLLAVYLAAVLTPLCSLAVLYALDQRAQALPVRYVRQAEDGFDCLAQVHTDLWGRDWAGHTEHRFWHALTRVPDGAERLSPAQLVGQVALGAGGRPEPIRTVRQERKARWEADFDRGHKEELQRLCFPGPTPPHSLAELAVDGRAEPLLAFTGDGGLVVTGGHTLFVLDAETGAVTRSLTLSDRHRFLSASQLEVVGPETALVLLSFEVYRADLRQGTLAPLAKTAYRGRSFAHDGHWVYFADTSDGISRVPLTGGTPERLFTHDARAGHLVLVGEELIWSVEEKLWRAPKSGGAPRLLATLPEAPPRPLVVAFGKLFARAGSSMLTVPLDGAAPSPWISLVDTGPTATGPAGLMVSGLVGESHAIRLYSSWEAPAPKVLLPGIRGRLGLAVSGDRVAWAELLEDPPVPRLVVVTQRLR